MAETFSKKELQKKKAKKKQDKADRREERKSNNNKGKTLEEMIVYLDEFGNLTDVPPDKQFKRKPNPRENTQEVTTQSPSVQQYTGMVTSFFVDKGYGFISEDQSRTSIFVHTNKCLEPIGEKDRVVFEKEKTPKGFAAIKVRKV